MKDQSFKEAEALGKIKTLPKEKEEKVEAHPEQSIDVIDTPDKFERAIGNAQLDGLDSIEVDEKLFKHLCKNSKTAYLTYGKPGIKVYLKGTRETNEQLEKMTADQFHDHICRENARNRKY